MLYMYVGLATGKEKYEIQKFINVRMIFFQEQKMEK